MSAEERDARVKHAALTDVRVVKLRTELEQAEMAAACARTNLLSEEAAALRLYGYLDLIRTLRDAKDPGSALPPSSREERKAWVTALRTVADEDDRRSDAAGRGNVSGFVTLGGSVYPPSASRPVGEFRGYTCMDQQTCLDYSTCNKRGVCLRNCLPPPVEPERCKGDCSYGGEGPSCGLEGCKG